MAAFSTFLNWLFHTSTGVLVLLAACALIALLLAALLERGTRRRYSDRGPAIPAATPTIDLENAGERLRARADALVDEVDALIDRNLSDTEDLEGPRDNSSGLVGALEDLWNSWDQDPEPPDDGD